MSAMETMVANMLKAIGVDPDEIKKEVVSRVEMFEQNIDRLNASLSSFDKRLAFIERAVWKIAEKLEIDMTGENANGNAGTLAQIGNEAGGDGKSADRSAE